MYAFDVFYVDVCPYVEDKKFLFCLMCSDGTFSLKWNYNLKMFMLVWIDFDISSPNDTLKYKEIFDV